LNVIVPVAVPEPTGACATVAVRVTDWPNWLGFPDDASVVADADRPTVSVPAANVIA
jgi:hypothetical protein